MLCPKKLAENWNTYKDNYVNNPIASDRLNYDVLFHTDLSRSGGKSNGLDLDRLNWGNYDLVVIDESHNFRNGIGTHSKTQDNRYQRLMDKVIRAGVKTKGADAFGNAGQQPLCGFEKISWLLPMREAPVSG